MSHLERDPGTGVTKVIDLLLTASPDRLLSLTHKLGRSTEENILHALCLFILQREVQALEKLQTLEDNILAKYLLEKWQRSTRNVEKLRVLCENFQESESLLTLARIFKVLTNHGLCERDLLNLAYRRALPSESSDSHFLEYNFILEEAKEVCGPEIVEMLSTFKNLTLLPGFHSKSEKGCPSGTTGSAQDLSMSNTPTSLQSTSSSNSFPSHLEISAPGIPGHITVNPRHPPESISKRPQEPFEAAATEESEEDEDTFYPFVILHAEEDEEQAMDMKVKVENIIKCTGATYSSDFAVLGRSLFKSVDEAISNSAYTFLLLTKNFNTFLEMKSNSALINSIDNPSKRDTVIPLLPECNGMPRDELPMVLKTLNPLVENKHFEKKILQALKPVRIKRQKELWKKEQERKRLKKEQEKLKISNQLQEKENKEHRALLELRQENRNLMCERDNYVYQQRAEGPGGTPLQQHRNITIENAQYIIIGDNSHMVVDLNKETGPK